jgi:hypothetical protein
MDLEVLNDYVLRLVGLFALCLYVLVVFAGFRDVLSRRPKAGTRKKKLRTVSAARRWRSQKRSPNS